LLSFVWLVHASSNPKTRLQTVAHTLIAAILIVDPISRYLKLVGGVDAWVVLGLRALFGLAVGGATKAVYSE
jgi:hypothetical protein